MAATLGVVDDVGVKTVIALSPREIEFGPSHRCLRVLLVYDDTVSGLRAKATFDRLMAQSPIEGYCALDLWQFDLLESPRSQLEGAWAAAKADILLLSLHGDKPLPPRVKTWLGLWLKQPGRGDQVLGVLFDLDHSTAPEAMETTLHLYRAAQQGRVKLFLGFSGPDHSPRLRISTPAPALPIAGFPLPIEAAQRLGQLAQTPCYG